MNKENIPSNVSYFSIAQIKWILMKPYHSFESEHCNNKFIDLQTRNEKSTHNQPRLWSAC